MNERDNVILNRLYYGTKKLSNFHWENMITVPLLNLITRDDIDYIRKLITSPRYSGNNRFKMEKIDEVMNSRGFSRFAGGTNRLVYEHPYAPNAVFKVAIDSVGITDNPSEFYNQQFLKPYCTKVFECSPCGTIASVEKVDRITNFDEFMSNMDDYYYIIRDRILGKYIMEDIGTNYFMNFGVRPGCGLVILDYPYLYELDGKKLECITEVDGSICHGEIDYDLEFNHIECTKCHRIYRARDLAKPPKDSHILIKDEGAVKMKIRLMRGNHVEKIIDTYNSSDHFERETVKPKTVDASQIVVKCIRVPVQTPKEENENKSIVAEPHVVLGRVVQGQAINNDPHIIRNNNEENKNIKVKKVVVSLKNIDSEEDTIDDNGIKVNCISKPIHGRKNVNVQKISDNHPNAQEVPVEEPLLERVAKVSLGIKPIDQTLVTETADEGLVVKLPNKKSNKSATKKKEEEIKKEEVVEENKDIDKVEPIVSDDQRDNEVQKEEDKTPVNKVIEHENNAKLHAPISLSKDENFEPSEELISKVPKTDNKEEINNEEVDPVDLVGISDESEDEESATVYSDLNSEEDNQKSISNINFETLAHAMAEEVKPIEEVAEEVIKEKKPVRRKKVTKTPEQEAIDDAAVAKLKKSSKKKSLENL